jgi:hypothetical protein
MEEQLHAVCSQFVCPEDFWDRMACADMAQSILQRCGCNGGGERRRKRRRTVDVANTQPCPGTYWRTPAYIDRLEERRGRGPGRHFVRKTHCPSLQLDHTGPPANDGVVGDDQAVGRPICRLCYQRWRKDVKLLEG